MAAERYLRITNNFLHDMATGTWAASLLVIGVLSGRMAGMGEEASESVGMAMVVIFGLAVGSLVVIGMTGGARLLYWRREASPEEITEKRRALLFKHALFAVVYGGGTWWAWTQLPL